MKKALILPLLLLSSAFAAKSIYIPSYITNQGMDLNSSSSQWCYARSLQTSNWIIFWESGFGSNPSAAGSLYGMSMAVDTAALKVVAEHSFATYQDSLRMIIKDSSIANRYKQIIFLHYDTAWIATGSGQDDSVGTLDLNPAAAGYASVAAHEIGHIFEYLTACDVPGAGYRWGFGTGGSGSNGFWEQVAQWEAWKAYPEQQFTDYDFANYLTGTHLSLFHENQRYANYFLPDYWTWKQGDYFLGKLWRSAQSPEDPVDTYMRLTGISTDSLSGEMYEHAARLTTWDLPKIRSFGANFIDSRAQVSMTASDNWWTVDSSVTPQNYGYNSIKLNPPDSATTVSVNFEGKAGSSGYRSVNVSKAGWRFGFVALLKDSTRVYSNSIAAKYANSANPSDSLDFSVPKNCSRLWFIVSGSPQEYWHHVWNDSVYDDEQWPYRVKFSGTNLLGQSNLPGKTTGLRSAPTMASRFYEIHGGILKLLPGADRLEVTDLRGRHLQSLGAGGSLPLSSLPHSVLLIRTHTADGTVSTSTFLSTSGN